MTDETTTPAVAEVVSTPPVASAVIDAPPPPAASAPAPMPLSVIVPDTTPPPPPPPEPEKKRNLFAAVGRDFRDACTAIAEQFHAHGIIDGDTCSSITADGPSIAWLAFETKEHRVCLRVEGGALYAGVGPVGNNASTMIKVAEVGA